MENIASIYNQEADSAEKQIAILKAQIEQLQQDIKNRTAYSSQSPEVRLLAAENTKLQYQCEILRNAMLDYDMKTEADRLYLQNIYSILDTLFAMAIQKAFPAIKNPPVVITLGSGPKFRDYQCNSAMALHKLCAQFYPGVKTTPREIAEKIIKNVQTCEAVSKLEVAGPGFINIFLSKIFVRANLSSIFANGVKLCPVEKPLHVLVDFSSPNIAKEMHVGHLRSTIIGESICRLLEYLSHKVDRINHVGDWGTQFGMLIAHLQDKFPDYLVNMPAIGDLQVFYKESKARFDSDEEFKKRAYACVVKLQSKEADYVKGWQLICEISRKEFQKIYDRLEVKIEERGESFYQDMMDIVVRLLENAALLEEDNGRKIMWPSNEMEENRIPLTIVKSDGGYTYDTSDMAAVMHRVGEGCNWVIYVTDAGQATHFDAVFRAARRAALLPEDIRMDHVPFGVVLGEDKKKLKTRSGDNIRLLDLLDEGLKRALDKLKEKERDKVLTPEELNAAQESIAYGCIKYADLSHNRNHEYVFSFDKMLEDKGNTAVYLLYAYTRIKSIARNANFTSEEIVQLAKTHKVAVDHEKEWKLCKVLMRLPEVLTRITKDWYLHQLCEYVYEIATTFTEFYDSCYCIEKDSSGAIVKINSDRILLAEATALIMEKCFYILGLKPVSRM